MVMVKPVIRVQYIQIRNHQGPGLLSKIYIKTHVGYHDFSTWLLIGWQDRFENRKKGKSLYLENGLYTATGPRFPLHCNLLWFGTGRFYPYQLGLFYWLCWPIMWLLNARTATHKEYFINTPYRFCNITATNQTTTKPCAQFVAWIV